MVRLSDPHIGLAVLQALPARNCDAVWSRLVRFPDSDGLASLHQGFKSVCVQAFIAEGTVEALYVSVWVGLAGLIRLCWIACFCAHVMNALQVNSGPLTVLTAWR